MKDYKIGVIGNGFVGSSLIHGFGLYVKEVHVYDKDPRKSINGLEYTIKNSDIIFLCLPTPMLESGECDLSFIYSTLQKINNFKKVDMGKKIFVIKSTVTPGTTDKLACEFKRLSLVFNPEFLTERTARLDFINASRIVLGGTLENLEQVESLYRQRFPHTPIIKTSRKSAEFIKYMCNCFFATKISFMNEMKQVGDVIGADWEKVIEGFLSDGRIGNSHVDVPGHDGDLGFGGTCFPKDVNAMICFAQQQNIEPKVLQAVWDKNLEVRKNKNWLTMVGRAVSTENVKKEK